MRRFNHFALNRFAFSGRLVISCLLFFQLPGYNSLMSATLVPANHPHLQYFGRWDMTDPLHPKHSWPGVYLYAEFSGTSIGVVCDWTGDRTLNLPGRFDRALMDAPEPKWDFRKWTPDLVVICLGLNDYSGLKDKEGAVSAEHSLLHRTRYHDFLSTIRRVYPGVTILAVAAHVDWIRDNVRRVVDEERAGGKQDIHYAQFDYFPDGYVANGHPSAATDLKIARQLIDAIEATHLFNPLEQQFRPLSDEQADPKADSVLALMTLDEKIALLGGDRSFFIRPLPRLNLPEVACG